MKTTAQNFGVLSDGTKVSLFTVKNRSMSFSVTDYGCRITSIILRDADGTETDVALGYSTLDGYIYDESYFGAFVGRFANRISGAAFTLGGERYTLDRNDGRNMLHGGLTAGIKRCGKRKPYQPKNMRGSSLRAFQKTANRAFPELCAFRCAMCSTIETSSRAVIRHRPIKPVP